MKERLKQSNVWKSFDVRKETQKHAIHRRHLLDYSDRVLFNNDPTRTPKRDRDAKIDHALSRTPVPKRNDLDQTSSVGYVELPYRQIVHELFTEDTNDLDEKFREIGIEPSNKTPKRWGTPLSKHQVNNMTIEDIDANHKRLQVQNNLDYATGMARKSGNRVMEQLITEDRKRAEAKALRDKWLEHRKRLKNVNQPRIEEYNRGKSKDKKKTNRVEKHGNESNKIEDFKSIPLRKYNKSNREPITKLGADESKPIYGFRRVENIDDILEKSKKRGGLNMEDIDPATVVLRCAKIRKSSADDLVNLQMSLDAFLKNELEFEEKRHDIKYVLNSRFDLLKKEIDHSVSVGGSDYKYDNQFKIDDNDRKILKQMRNSVKYRRKKALQSAEQIRKKTMKNILDRRMDQTRIRLGLRPRNGLISGSDYDQAAADILKPKEKGVRSM